MKIKMLCLAVLSLLSLAVSAQTGNIKTIQADVFPMTEFPAAYGYRVLTKGNDSAPKSWGLTVTRANFSGKPMITYRNQKGKFFSVQKELTPFQLNRITVCFDNGKATMYPSVLLYHVSPLPSRSWTLICPRRCIQTGRMYAHADYKFHLLAYTGARASWIPV